MRTSGARKRIYSFHHTDFNNKVAEALIVITDFEDGNQ